MGTRYRSEGDRVWKHKRRAFDKGRPSDLRTSQWLYLLVVYETRCAYCGGTADTMDHIVPLENGGGTTKTNVLPCCDACNQAKGTAVWLPAKAGEGRVVKW